MVGPDIEVLERDVGTRYNPCVRVTVLIYGYLLKFTARARKPYLADVSFASVPDVADEEVLLDIANEEHRNAETSTITILRKEWCCIGKQLVESDHVGRREDQRR